jgi:hypothetical protein
MFQSQAAFRTVLASIALAIAGPTLAQTINQNNLINVAVSVGVGNNQSTTMNQTGQRNYGVVVQRGSNLSANVNQTGDYINGVYVSQAGGGTSNAYIGQSSTMGSNFAVVQQGWSFSRR